MLKNYFTILHLFNIILFIAGKSSNNSTNVNKLNVDIKYHFDTELGRVQHCYFQNNWLN